MSAVDKCHKVIGFQYLSSPFKIKIASILKITVRSRMCLLITSRIPMSQAVRNFLRLWQLLQVKKKVTQVLHTFWIRTVRYRKLLLAFCVEPWSHPLEKFPNHQIAEHYCMLSCRTQEQTSVQNIQETFQNSEAGRPLTTSSNLLRKWHSNRAGQRGAMAQYSLQLGRSPSLAGSFWTTAQGRSDSLILVLYPVPLSPAARLC